MIIKKGTPVRVPNKKRERNIRLKPAGVLGLCTPYQTKPPSMDGR